MWREENDWFLFRSSRADWLLLSTRITANQIASRLNIALRLSFSSPLRHAYQSSLARSMAGCCFFSPQDFERAINWIFELSRQIVIRRYFFFSSPQKEREREGKRLFNTTSSTKLCQSFRYIKCDCKSSLSLLTARLSLLSLSVSLWRDEEIIWRKIDCRRAYV